MACQGILERLPTWKPHCSCGARSEWLPCARRLCEPIGDDPQGRRVKPEADVRGHNLDILPVVALPFETGAPRHDAVGARIDRR